MSEQTLQPYKITTLHAQGAGTIPIADLFIGKRLRAVTKETLDYINKELVPSIGEHGLIHPITVSWSEEQQKFELIAGWSRVQAFKILGIADIPYALREAMNEEQLLKLEMEENLRRNEMRWQDKVIGVYRVHMFEKQRAAARHSNWTMAATGKILGMTHGLVSYILPVAEAVMAGDVEVLACEHYTVAQKLLLARKEKELVQALHDRSKLAGAKPIVMEKTTNAGALRKPTAAQRTIAEATSGVLGGADLDFDILPSGAKLANVQAKQAIATTLAQSVIDMSKKVINADCVDWMKAQAPDQFDLIYTDPPFAIEMDMLKKVQNIDVVVESHDVEENLQLLERFMPEAFRVLKPGSYMFLWYDIVHQEKMTAWGTRAGFKVVNWPLLWLKPAGEAKNEAAYTNHTKACEYIMVLKKGECTLRSAFPVNWWVASVKGERSAQLNPFPKPFSISKEIIEHTIVPGMKMLDCFAGGGSITRAAINLGIDVVAVEKDPKQYPALCESVKSTYREITGGAVEFA